MSSTSNGKGDQNRARGTGRFRALALGADEAHQPRGVGRRGFLKAAGLGAAAAPLLGMGAPAVIARPGGAPSPARRARNVVFMVADGMSTGTLQLADQFSMLRRQEPAWWTRLIAMPGARRAVQSTYAADSLVTDSAAASSAWAIGARVNNGALSILPDGSTPTPILVHARQSGRLAGVVTTTRITHATPAGFAVNIPGRDMEDEIAVQMLERGIDVMLGGGTRHFADDVLDRHPGYKVFRTRAELQAARSRDGEKPLPMLGLFNHSHLSFSIDPAPDEPSLAEMSLAALEAIDNDGAGFVLQIEGGRVDHAAHANDAAALLHDMLAFDEAVGAVLNWMKPRDDTLLIVTTDHGNANPGLTDYGARGNEGFARLAGASRSFDWIIERLQAPDFAGTGASLRAVIEQATGLVLSTEETDILLRWGRGERVDPYLNANKDTGPLGSILANHYQVAFLSPNHTSDFTEVTAIGPGSEALPPVCHLTDLHGLMVNAMSLGPAQPVE